MWPVVVLCADKFVMLPKVLAVPMVLVVAISLP